MNLYHLHQTLMQPTYLGLNLIDAAAALNDKVISRSRLVPIDDIEALLATSGELFAILGSSAPELEPARWLFSNQHKLRNLDMQALTTQALVDALKQAGLVSESTVLAIQRMGSELISVAEQLGLGHVSPEDVRRARELQ